MRTLSIYCLSLFLVIPAVSFAQDEMTGDEEDVQVERVRKTTKKQEATREISGRVVSQQDHAPLAGVLIQSIAGEGYSVLSGEDGTFRLQVPIYSSAVEVTIPGYNKVRVGLNKSGLLRDIVLQSEASRPLYGADDNILGTARADRFDYSNAHNIETEIGNQLGADVRTISRSGISGIGSYMQIGGVGSYMLQAQPLVVIDGVITDMQYDREMLHSGFYNDILSNINVNDIASVEILKNGTALYGAKGANGVILIKTKRNRSLATRIDATASVGIELVPRHYQMMDGPQFKSYASTLLQSTGTKSQSFKFLNPDQAYYWYNKYNNNTDWTDGIYREAFTQNYGLSVQGGGDVANYMLTLGYIRANETIKEANNNRLNVRFNTDIKISDYIDFRFDASYANTTRKLYNIGAPEDYDNGTITSVNFLSYAKSPMLSPYSFVATGDQGTINPAHLDIEAESYLEEVTQLRNSNYELANPLAILQYGTAPNKNYFDNSFLNLAITPSWHPNKHLSFSSLFSYSLVNTNEKSYIPMNGVPSFYVAAYNQKFNNMIGSLYSKQNSITSDTRINWENRYGAHAINLLGGFRFLSESYSLTRQNGYNTGSDKTPLINLTQKKQIYGTHEDWATLTWYGQAKYNYANRYYLQGDIAMETNSQFGHNVKGALKLGGVSWGIFPSIQAGWVLTNERWFDVAGIDYLKISAGFGVSGNDRLPFDASHSYFKSNLFLNEIPGLSLENIGNDQLKWETTRRFNASIEGRFLNNRLAAGFNYFKSWTDDLLTLGTLNFLTGIEQNWSNGGSLENEGFDFYTSAHLISGNKWNWSIGGSMGHYVNKLTSLPNGATEEIHSVLGGYVISRVGESINQFYGYKTEKTASGGIVYATFDEATTDGLYILGADKVTKTPFGAGDVKYANIYNDGTGEIDERDRTVIGDANPDIYGNFWTSLSYKRITLDVGFNYSLGGDVYNYMRHQLESGSRFMNQTTAMLSRWSYEGQVTDVPRATYADPMGNSAFSDRWIEDGSYLRLKNVTISYKLPINNTYIQGITVWARGNNLLTFTKYLGSDPEFSMNNNLLYQGIDCGYQAAGRSFNIGVKVNL